MNWLAFLAINVGGNLITALIFRAVMKKAGGRTDWSREKKAKVLVTTSMAGSLVLALANLGFALQLVSTGESLWGLALWGGMIGFHISSAFATRRTIRRRAGIESSSEAD